MSNQIQYFPPVDEIQILSQETLSPYEAADLIHSFTEQQSNNHELPNMTLYFLKGVHSAVIRNAPLLSKQYNEPLQSNQQK